jgi:hypothetical protein
MWKDLVHMEDSILLSQLSHHYGLWVLMIKKSSLYINLNVILIYLSSMYESLTENSRALPHQHLLHYVTLIVLILLCLLYYIRMSTVMLLGV